MSYQGLTVKDILQAMGEEIAHRASVEGVKYVGKDYDLDFHDKLAEIVKEVIKEYL